MNKEVAYAVFAETKWNTTTHRHDLSELPEEVFPTREEAEAYAIKAYKRDTNGRRRWIRQIEREVRP